MSERKMWETVDDTFISLADADEGIMRMLCDKDFFEKYCDNVGDGEGHTMARAIVRMLYDLPHIHHNTAIEVLKLIPDNATNNEVFNKVFDVDNLTEMVDIVDTYHGGKTVMLNKFWGEQLYDEWKDI